MHKQTHHSLFAILSTFVFICTLFAITTPKVQAEISASYLSPSWVQEKLSVFFKDTPEMVAIAKCESGFRQYRSDGSALYGGTGGMVGLFQLSATYHREAAAELGLDIDTIMGNILYAKHLYEEEGTVPWLASAHCWEKEINTTAKSSNTTSSKISSTLIKVAEAAEVSTTNTSNLKTTTVSTEGLGSLTMDLEKNMVEEEVRLLQKRLNAKGYTVATSGPGRPGGETNIFGELTYKAVVKFQCEQKIVCAGESGYGQVGEQTRAKLNQ